MNYEDIIYKIFESDLFIGFSFMFLGIMLYKLGRTMQEEREEGE